MEQLILGARTGSPELRPGPKMPLSDHQRLAPPPEPASAQPNHHPAPMVS